MKTNHECSIRNELGGTGTITTQRCPGPNMVMRRGRVLLMGLKHRVGASQALWYGETLCFVVAELLNQDLLLRFHLHQGLVLLVQPALRNQ